VNFSLDCKEQGPFLRVRIVRSKARLTPSIQGNNSLDSLPSPSPKKAERQTLLPWSTPDGIPPPPASRACRYVLRRVGWCPGEIKEQSALIPAIDSRAVTYRIRSNPPSHDPNAKFPPLSALQKPGALPGLPYSRPPTTRPPGPFQSFRTGGPARPCPRRPSKRIVEEHCSPCASGDDQYTINPVAALEAPGIRKTVQPRRTQLAKIKTVTSRRTQMSYRTAWILPLKAASRQEKNFSRRAIN